MEITQKEYNKALQLCYEYKEQLRIEYHGAYANYKEVTIKHINVTPESSISATDLSVRAYNALRYDDVHFVKDIAKYSIKDLLRFRNLGKKSLEEIKELCVNVGIKLKYQL